MPKKQSSIHISWSERRRQSYHDIFRQVQEHAWTSPESSLEGKSSCFLKGRWYDRRLATEKVAFAEIWKCALLCSGGIKACIESLTIGVARSLPDIGEKELFLYIEECRKLWALQKHILIPVRWQSQGLFVWCGNPSTHLPQCCTCHGFPVSLQGHASRNGRTLCKS